MVGSRMVVESLDVRKTLKRKLESHDYFGLSIDFVDNLFRQTVDRWRRRHQRRSTTTNAEMGMPCCKQTTVCTRPTTTIHQHSNRDRGRQLTNRIGLNDSVERRSLVSKPKSFIFISNFVLSTLTDDGIHHHTCEMVTASPCTKSHQKRYSPSFLFLSVFYFDRQCHDDDHYDIWDNACWVNLSLIPFFSFSKLTFVYFCFSG